MKRATASHRGEPIWALAVILGGWVAMRALLWETMPYPTPLAAALPHSASPFARREQPFRDWHQRLMTTPGQSQPASAAPRPAAPAEPVLPGATPAMAYPASPHAVMVAPGITPAPLPARPPAAAADSHGASHGATNATSTEASDNHAPMRPSVAAAHQLMWMAAVANLPSPQELVGQYAAAAASPKAPAFALVATAPPAQPAGGEWLAAQSPAIPPPPRHAAPRRWSADGWLLIREGGVPSPGSSLPTYGAAQTGAVLRYHLAPASGFAPTAYVRGYAAINGSGERQAALGLSARPLPRIPVAAMVEVRASRFSDGTLHWRPAATLVSEFAPLALPLGLRAETYVQGGYVGGSAATGFIDGQLKLDRAVSHISRGGLTGELRAGAGVWGGGQTGASRIDIGPSVSLGLTSGPAAARLAADWRFRVGGNATPASGPALTISAGF